MNLINTLRIIISCLDKTTLIELHKELRYFHFENEGEEAPALKENKEVTLILKEIERRLEIHYQYKSQWLYGNWENGEDE